MTHDPPTLPLQSVLLGIGIFLIPSGLSQPSRTPGMLPPPNRSSAAGNPRTNAPVVPPLTLGKVTIDQASRTVSFPAVVNQRSGPVEYAVVTTYGKTHEAVFRTEADPLHVHLALVLLGLTPAGTNLPPFRSGMPLTGERVWLDFSWQRDGVEFRYPLEEVIRTTNNLLAMPSGPWIHTGSRLLRGTLDAQRDGSLVAVYEDPLALINNPRDTRNDDDIHHVNPEVLPPDDQPLTLTIRLTPLFGPGAPRALSRPLPPSNPTP